MLTEADILEALRACYAPAPPSGSLNIVELGLVEAIALAPDMDAPGAGIPGVPPKQFLRLTLVRPAGDEDVQIQLHAQVVNRLAGLPELSRVVVGFHSDAVWTSDRVTPAGRRVLALDFPILNNRLR
jgi:metal-sulfur cluster biosynthetic enzyme